MGRLAGGQIDPATYTEAHVKAVLEACQVRVATDTFHDFLCFCPFHNNRHTPSLSVSKTKNSYLCFNADCSASGSLTDLVSKTTGRNYFEASRFITQKAPTDQEIFNNDLEVLLDERPEFREFSPEVLGNLSDGMQIPGNPGRAYLQGRGFTDDTIDYFKVGYSAKKDMVAVPMHSPDGIPVGVVGRSITGKTFKNSVGLPTSKTFFNLHRAKRIGGTVIVTESSFDTMAVHQAGYPNAVGNLGGHMSPQKLYLLNRYFDKIILFLDDDVPGHTLAQKIANRFATSKDVMYAKSENWLGGWYAYSCKDASEILEKHGEQDIRNMIQQAIPVWEYNSLVVQ